MQYVFLRHISYVFIESKPPHKPSHIVQAYQNVLRDPIVEHKNRSIRKISLKNQYFKHLLSLKGAVQQNNRKTAQAPPFNPENLLGYIYSILYCNAYREKYASELRTCFPRLLINRRKTHIPKTSQNSFFLTSLCTRFIFAVSI